MSTIIVKIFGTAKMASNTHTTGTDLGLYLILFVLLHRAFDHDPGSKNFLQHSGMEWGQDTGWYHVGTLYVTWNVDERTWA